MKALDLTVHAVAALSRRGKRRFRRTLYARDAVTGLPTGAVALEDAVASGLADVGPHTYGDLTLYSFPGTPTSLKIGAYCSIGGNVRVMGGGNHRTDWLTTFPLRVAWNLPGAHMDGHPAPSRGITIGSDVWIGDSALILDGVSIGDGAVIGTHAVVTRDVRPYAVAVGNPAREVRRRFSDQQVQALLAIKWWDWPDDIIRDRVDELCSADVDHFVATYWGR